MIHLCFEADPFRYRLFLGNLMAALDPAMSDFNRVQLQAKESTLDAVHREIQALPVMSDQRIVVAEGILTKIATSAQSTRSKKGKLAVARRWQDCLAVLDDTPDTTVLVLHEPGMWQDKADALKMLPTDGGPSIGGLARAGRLQWQNLVAPKPHELPGWIEARCLARKMRLVPKGVVCTETGRRVHRPYCKEVFDKIGKPKDPLRESDAIHALVETGKYVYGPADALKTLTERLFRVRKEYRNVGGRRKLVDLIHPEDLANLEHELDKLLIYAYKPGGTCPQGLVWVDSDAVMELVPLYNEAWVFHFCKALFGQQKSETISILREVLGSGDDPIAILGAIGAGVRREVGKSQFTLEQIKDMTDLMLQADLDMKTTLHAEDVLYLLVGRLLTDPATWGSYLEPVHMPADAGLW